MTEPTNYDLANIDLNRALDKALSDHPRQMYCWVSLASAAIRAVFALVDAIDRQTTSIVESLPFAGKGI